MKHDEYIDSLIARELAGESLSATQRSALDEWAEAHGEEYARLRRLIGGHGEPRQLSVDTGWAWTKVEARLSRRRAKSLRTIGIAASIAAAIALLAGFTLFFGQGKDSGALTLANNTEASRSVGLPDGSRLILYPHATISYTTADGERRLSLRGKSFFSIKRDTSHPFVVTTHSVQVRVIGTAFLIDALKPHDTRVYVKEGQVSVSTRGSKVLLHTGEKVQITDTEIKKENIADAETFFGERPAMLKFTNAPIADVAARLEAIYGITIELGEGINKNRVTTQLKLGDIDNVLVELSYLCNCKLEKIDSNHFKLHYQ